MKVLKNIGSFFAAMVPFIVFCSADHCQFLGIFIALAVEMMSSSAFTETISDKSSLVIGITDVFIKKSCF